MRVISVLPDPVLFDSIYILVLYHFRVLSHNSEAKIMQLNIYSDLDTNR